MDTRRPLTTTYVTLNPDRRSLTLKVDMRKIERYAPQGTYQNEGKSSGKLALKGETVRFPVELAA